MAAKLYLPTFYLLPPPFWRSPERLTDRQDQATIATNHVYLLKWIPEYNTCQ